MIQLLSQYDDSIQYLFKVDVVIAPGTHESEAAVNKQLADKERVAAALENPNLLEVVNQCLATTRGTMDDEE